MQMKWNDLLPGDILFSRLSPDIENRRYYFVIEHPHRKPYVDEYDDEGTLTIMYHFKFTGRINVMGPPTFEISRCTLTSDREIDPKVWFVQRLQKETSEG